MGEARRKGTRFERMARAIVRRQDAAEVTRQMAVERAIATVRPIGDRIVRPAGLGALAALMAVTALAPPSRRR